jgi:hypothetical protein
MVDQGELARAHPRSGTGKSALLQTLRVCRAVFSWVVPPADGVPHPPCSRTVERAGCPALPHPFQTILRGWIACPRAGR